MLPWLDAGNPSSLYSEGRRAKAAIDQAREHVTSALRCLFAEFLFTSGGTEAANMAILGAALANPDPTRTRVLFPSVEHHAVLHTQPTLERLGYRVELLPVDREGRLLPFRVDPNVLLVAGMHANNELGTVHDVRSLAELAHSAGALFFCDAVQTFRKWNWTVDEVGADLLAVSAHKLHGPKGVGGLYVRAGTRIAALQRGGGQERDMRGGTENVAGIVGFGAAVAAPVSREGVRERRDALRSGLLGIGAIPTVNDAPTLDGHLHVRFPGRDAETMLIQLDRAGISASSGSACSSGSVEPSHVMVACGYSVQEAKESVRFTLGPEAFDAKRVMEAVAKK